MKSSLNALVDGVSIMNLEESLISILKDSGPDPWSDCEWDESPPDEPDWEVEWNNNDP